LRDEALWYLIATRRLQVRSGSYKLADRNLSLEVGRFLALCLGARQVVDLSPQSRRLFWLNSKVKNASSAS